MMNQQFPNTNDEEFENPYSTLPTPRRRFGGRGRDLLVLGIAFLAVLIICTLGLIVAGNLFSVPSPNNGSSQGTVTSTSTVVPMTNVTTVYNGSTVTLFISNSPANDGTLLMTLVVSGKSYTSTFQPISSYVHRGVDFLARGLILWFRYDPNMGMVKLCQNDQNLVEFLKAPATPCGAQWTEAPQMIKK